MYAQLSLDQLYCFQGLTPTAKSNSDMPCMYDFRPLRDMPLSAVKNFKNTMSKLTLNTIWVIVVAGQGLVWQRNEDALTYATESNYCYLGSHKMKGAALMLFTVATRTCPVFHNAPDVL